MQTHSPQLTRAFLTPHSSLLPVITCPSSCAAAARTRNDRKRTDRILLLSTLSSSSWLSGLLLAGDLCPPATSLPSAPSPVHGGGGQWSGRVIGHQIVLGRRVVLLFGVHSKRWKCFQTLVCQKKNAGSLRIRPLTDTNDLHYMFLVDMHMYMMANMCFACKPLCEQVGGSAACDSLRWPAMACDGHKCDDHYGTHSFGLSAPN